MRIATYAGDFSRKGPGLLLRDLLKDAPVPGVGLIAQAAPDVILLTDMDYDAGHAALTALQNRLSAFGHVLPYLFALRPNTGMATGFDLDGDGRLGGPRDAQGYGWFSGQGGQAILSRFPLELQADHTSMLWREVPNSLIAPDDPAFGVQRLSSSAHWAVEVATPQGVLLLLTLSATPPIFDGPEDRNGRRNHDEVLLWPRAMDGAFGPWADRNVVLLGNFNLDPDRGDGLHRAVRQVLEDPRLRDPTPGVQTAQWDRVGPLRLSYVLPSRDLKVTDAGVTPPAEGAGPHQLIWVDLELAE